MKKHFPLLLLVAVLLSSCSAIYTYRESTARYVDIDDIKENFIEGMRFHYFSSMKDAVAYNFGK